MNESPAVGLAAEETGHSKRDRRFLGRAGEPNRESFDLDNTRQVVGCIRGDPVEANDLAVAVVVRRPSPGSPRAVTADRERTERIPDCDVVCVGVQREEWLDIPCDD